MKGLLGLVFLGICIILAAALLAGALTFPEAMSLVFGVLFWIIVLVVIIIVAFFGIVIIALHEKPKSRTKRKTSSFGFL